MREAQKNLLSSVTGQSEKFIAMLMEANLKNDMRLKQYMRKVELINKKEAI